MFCYHRPMSAENLGRFELIVAWQRRCQQLRQEGECARHIEAFLARLESLSGETVAEIGHCWSQRHAEQRPLLTLLLLCGATLLLALSFHWLFLIAYVVVAITLVQNSWQSERRFAHELFARADYVFYSPA